MLIVLAKTQRTVALPMVITDDNLTQLQRHGARRDLDTFRTNVYQCCTLRSEALFELADALACSTGCQRPLGIAHLSLEAGQERGHGGVYDALNAGSIDEDDLGRVLAQAPIPTIHTPDGKDEIVLAVDVSNWLRPAAGTSPG